MKVVILAGGFGTRISEESHLRPKPMVEIGGMPMLWHIMKYYYTFGFDDFIICCGYKQEVIKEFFYHYALYQSDVTFDFSRRGEMTVRNNHTERWKVTLVDTGFATMTGGRVKRIAPFVGKEPFLLTYGDGVGDVDLKKLIQRHEEAGNIVTITAVQPSGRFGSLGFDPQTGRIDSFAEKKKEDGGWINGGFMVAEPELFELIEGDQTTLEREPLEHLAESGQLGAYFHEGFWQCMDNVRDRNYLEELWTSGAAPWKIWNS